MSERITINLTEPKEEITFTLTDQKEEVVFSFSEAARGPQGEPGPDASVTNANVNAAIESNPSATRDSLDLGTAALADTGTGASNVILGNDARLTDARTPTAHASSHVTGGTDKIRDASAAQDGLMTTTFAAKLNGIEAGADVTDATNVNAAGAVMESDYSPAHSILVQQSGTGSPSSLSIGNNTLVGRLSGGGSAIDDLSASQVRTLLNVEDGADVTDAANVASTITGAAAKTTLVDADITVLTDSAASFGLKKVTWLNVWNYIVTKIGAITSITAGGAWSFSSTTRPTSSGTGLPAAASLMTLTDIRNREARTYYGSELAGISVFNGGVYTGQNPANYWQRGVLLRDAQTDALTIPIPQNWDGGSIRLKVYAARAGGTAGLTGFVIREKTRYITTTTGEQSQALADSTSTDVTRNFSGASNSICLNFEITIALRAYSANETRIASLQRVGSDAADTMDTSLIIYQIDLLHIP